MDNGNKKEGLLFIFLIYSERLGGSVFRADSLDKHINLYVRRLSDTVVLFSFKSISGW